MTYQMSWERTRNVWDEFDTDTNTITDENDYLDEDLFIPTPNFDPLEILQGIMSDPYVILRVSTNRKKETNVSKWTNIPSRRFIHYTKISSNRNNQGDYSREC